MNQDWGEVLNLSLVCVCVCVSVCVSVLVCMRVSQAPLPIWDGRVPSIKSSVSVSKLEMPISLYAAPYLISPSPSSHHLAPA